MTGEKKMEKQFYVYILASQKNGTLYAGVTSNLHKRMWEHREGIFEGFTKKYGVKNLMYYEVFMDAENAIHREKRLKKYTRAAKIKLIETANSDWKDLYEEICS
jgi:putative endonuclease